MLPCHGCRLPSLDAPPCNCLCVALLCLPLFLLQVEASDFDGAKSMVVSSTTLSKGCGDLHTQVAGVSMLQQLLQHQKDSQTAAQNANYVAHKQEQLSVAIQAAEADSKQHSLVLTWGV